MGTRWEGALLSWVASATLLACGGPTDERTTDHGLVLQSDGYFYNQTGGTVVSANPPTTAAEGATPDAHVLPQPRDKHVDDMPGAICDEPFLAAKFELDAESELPIYYVSAATAGDLPLGTSDAPFQNIGAALAAVRSPTRILVATGSYAESLNVPSGVQLLGGYDAATWQPSAEERTSLDAPAITFSAASDFVTAPAVLDGFEVNANVVVLAGAKVVLQHNRLVPKLDDVTWETHGDTHVATALTAKDASVRIRDNEIVLSAEDPNQVIGRGIILNSSCARIVDNELVDFRIPMSIHDSDEVMIGFNRLTRGKNGFWLDSSDVALVGNVAQLTPPSNGCVYALYLQGDSKPLVRGNDFSLQTSNNRWVSESSPDADPVELTANTLYLGSPGTVLYIDEAAPVDEQGSNWIKDIDQVNVLADIPTLSNNVVATGAAQ